MPPPYSGRPCFSNTWTEWPDSLSICATARPPIPATKNRPRSVNCHPGPTAESGESGAVGSFYHADVSKYVEIVAPPGLIATEAV